MRVLIVTDYIPHFPGPGAATREYCLARELAKHHEITFLLPQGKDQERVKVDALASFCSIHHAEPVPALMNTLQHRIMRRLNWVFWHRLPLSRHVYQLVGPSKLVQDWVPIVTPLRLELLKIDWNEFDLIQIEQSLIAYILRDIDIPIPSVIDWLDLQSSIKKREYQTTLKWNQRMQIWIEWYKTVLNERQVAEQFDTSLVMSELDGSRLQKLSKKASISVVPNGVDCEYFHNFRPEHIDNDTLVFTGLMDYEPNVMGVLFFCEQVFPLLMRDYPHVILYIVGARPTPVIQQLANKYPGAVFVTGAIDDVRPYIQRATVTVVPLLNGGGTRLKILEAMSMQKAVVSTSIGCEGLNIVHGENILIADNPRAFAGAVLSLLSDPMLRNKIAFNGSRLVRDFYDWKSIGKKQEDAWLEAMSRHNKQGKMAR